MRRAVAVAVGVAALVSVGIVEVALVSSDGMAAPPDALATLVTDFDAHADRTRVLALLSPT
jgi:hypothetical protein